MVTGRKDISLGVAKDVRNWVPGPAQWGPQAVDSDLRSQIRRIRRCRQEQRGAQGSLRHKCIRGPSAPDGVHIGQQQVYSHAGEYSNQVYFLPALWTEGQALARQRAAIGRHRDQTPALPFCGMLGIPTQSR